MISSSFLKSFSSDIILDRLTLFKYHHCLFLVHICQVLNDLFYMCQSLYQKALTIKSAIPHPRIMGIIHECGGKMHMAERHWRQAATDFFEAFKNYDEAGNHRRIQCLKCV